MNRWANTDEFWRSAVEDDIDKDSLLEVGRLGKEKVS